ncbi:MAG TPA: caspase family protein [Mucilaginibacter sp.]|nr:caspase family protein [Mucilaginibacter sp.]
MRPKRLLEIQLLSPLTIRQLTQLRDEIRSIDGLNKIDIEYPLSPAGKDREMGDSLLETIILATITGVIEMSSSMAFEQLLKQIIDLIKKNFADDDSQKEVKDPNNIGMAASWEAVVINEENGIRNGYFIDSLGTQKGFSNKEYTIKPQKTYAIISGIREYDDKLSFNSIPPVSNNVDGIFKVLIDKRLLGLPIQNIIRIENENSVVIKNELNNICKKDDIETIIIYYTGHGQNLGKGQLSLIAKDTWNIDNELHNDIPFSFIERMLKNSNASQKIVIIDACQSGLAAQQINNTQFEFEDVLGIYILSSTSGEESSYFNPESEYTYFTGALLEILKKGLPNTNTMLSLADLYKFTRTKLEELGLPLPSYKSKLNILPEKFFISTNLSFSLDDLLKRPKHLYEQGDYIGARNEYLVLESRYPENEQLKKEHLEFEQNLKVKELVKQGDMLFWLKDDINAAFDKYEKAYSLKKDPWIADKIRDCINKNKSVDFDSNVELIPYTPNYVTLETTKTPVKKKILFGFLTITIVIIAKVIFSSLYPSTNGAVPKAHRPTNVTQRILQANSDKNNTANIPKASNAVTRIKTDSIKIRKPAKQLMVINSIDKDKPFTPDSSVKPMLIGLAKVGKRRFDNGDYDIAYNLLYKSREINDPEVWFDLAYMKSNGKGTKLDFRKAIEYYLKSAELGNSSAENNLGWLFGSGKGTLRDYQKAVEWYTKAAQAGNPSAETNLGLMYEQGKGVTKSPGDAITWYRKAARQGDKDAIDNLHRLHFSE